MTSYTNLATFICFSLFVAAQVCQGSGEQLQKAIDILEANKLKIKCSRLSALSTKYAVPTNPCSKDVIAYYRFDRFFRDVCYGNNGAKEGIVTIEKSSGIVNGAAFFRGRGKIRVARLNGFKWGSKFSVSLWFKRTGHRSTYQGLINNGYHSHGSWEIRMGREQSGQMIGGGIVTKTSPSTWDYAGIKATFDHWHHVVMTYNGTHLDYYLDNAKQKAKKSCCQGDIVTKTTDVVIGQAGHGMSSEYFYGYIDEVKLFKKWLSPAEVQQLYQLKNV